MNQLYTPKWITLGEQLIGLHELPGPETNPAIADLWHDAHLSGIKDDSVPWCAGFVDACLENAGIKSARSDSAQAYRLWGTPLATPIYGCVVVFHGPGVSHVGFFVGKGTNGDYAILGGNQDNKVSIAMFKPRYAVSFRWPNDIPMITQDTVIPTVNARPAMSVA